MTSLEEKVRAIIDNVGDDFNSLPFEERKRIARFTSQQQILTIWQMMNKNKDITTDRWRKEQRKWLENCVNSHQREWGDY